MEFICTYVNSSGISSVQHLTNAKFDDLTSPKYVQGWDINANHPKTLRYDRVVQIFDSIDKATQEFGTQKYKLPPEYDSSQSTRYSSPDTMDVCFTGFAKTDKGSLIQLAEKNSMIVRASVTKHLDILCYGYNAGPKKLEKALSQGVFILNKYQFEIMIETGEVPEDL